MDYNQFAESIKSKYPQYKEVDNLTLSKKMVEKYPQYASKVSFGETKKKTFGEKVSNTVQDIFPGKRVGEAIGTLAGYVGSKNKEFYDTSAPTPTQVIGDVAAGAASIVGVKSPVPVTKLGRVVQSAAIGGVEMGSRSAAEGNEGIDVLKDAGKGALLGGAIQGGFEGTKAVRESFAKLPSRLIRSATGQSKKAILAGQDLTKYVLDNKKIGTAESLIKQSQEQIDKASNIINQNLQQSTGTVAVDDIFDRISKSEEASNALLSIDDIKDTVKALAPQSRKLIEKGQLTLSEANKLRSLLDRTIGDRGFLVSQQPLNKQLLREFSNTLRETVKTQAPEGTRSAFNTLANEIRLRDALAEKVARGSRNQIISFGDLIGGGIGGVAGGIPGAIVGAGVKRIIESTGAKTATAVSIDQIAKLLRKLDPAEQALITSIISALPQDGAEDKQPQQE
jgi:hypothetical protein